MSVPLSTFAKADIATEAGCTQAAVSAYWSNPYSVAPATKTAIEAACVTLTIDVPAYEAAELARLQLQAHPVDEGTAEAARLAHQETDPADAISDADPNADDRAEAAEEARLALQAR